MSSNTFVMAVGLTAVLFFGTKTSAQAVDDGTAIKPDSTISQPKPAPAREQESLDIESGVSYESLTQGFAPWRRAYVNVLKRTAEHQAIYGTVEETERFMLNDTAFTAGIYQPLGKRWTSLFEGSISPTHAVLAKWSALGQIEHALGAGWSAHIGLGHREYTTATVNMANAAIEKDVKAFRLSYTFYASYLDSAGMATTHRAEIGYQYADSSINLNLAYGNELDNIPPDGVLRTNVRLVNLGGTHWFARTWGISYTGSWQEQGTIYTRRGLTLGLRHRL